tara:strand:- start:162 stop:470 length:309 start_codon:yes stop_codon:yes gene_type:complete
MFTKIAMFVLKLLPEWIRDYVDVTRRIFQRLDTAEERKAVMASLIRMQKSDGYISATDWTGWGSQLGVIGKRKGPHAQSKGHSKTQSVRDLEWDDSVVAPTN